jgi:hypothetical protein
MNTAAAETASILSEADVRHFEEHGYVYVRNAFADQLASAARGIIWKDHLTPAGIDLTDANSWPVRHGIATVYTETDGDPWKNILTNPRLRGAISQLLGGEERWDKDSLGCGWWVISFPRKEPAPWGTSGKWHVDGMF